MNKKYLIITLICLVMSLIYGIIAQDLLIGGTILLTGLLCAYFASEGKRINYILGLINYLLMGLWHLKTICLEYFSFIYLFFHHYK